MMEQARSPRHRTDRGATPSDRRRTASGIEVVVAGLLREAGVVRVLQYLNARTRYRFTGVYRVDPPLLRNMYLFDRENPTLNCSGAVTPLDETYCSITASLSAPFSTADAGRDPRLREHAARESVLCYSGVPIRLASGATWGTLCHFDLRPRLMPRDELAVLEAAAPMIAQSLAAVEDQPRIS